MDFSLTDEQQMLRETARSLLADRCPSALVREHMEEPSVAMPLFDRYLREWVVLGCGSAVDLCLFMEEAGRVLLPGPYFTTTALFSPMLEAVADRRASQAASGETTGTVALAGSDGAWQVNGDPVRRFVLEADRVDLVAVVLPGPEVAVLPAGEVPAVQVKTLDTSRRIFDLHVPPGLRGSAIPAELVELVLRRATIALSAELVGVASWLLETTISYSRERVQFDRPIGSFQGLQWMMVEMALEVERATAAVYYAAMALDAGDPDLRRATHVAKAAAGSAARTCALSGLQIHGGIGYTWEHDLHLYLRRAFASDDLLGDVSWHHGRLGELAVGAP